MITEKETGTLTVDHQGNGETRKANTSNGKSAQTNKKRRKQTKNKGENTPTSCVHKHNNFR